MLSAEDKAVVFVLLVPLLVHVVPSHDQRFFHGAADMEIESTIFVITLDATARALLFLLANVAEQPEPVFVELAAN